jgi:hypothetical protein
MSAHQVSTGFNEVLNQLEQRWISVRHPYANLTA